MVHLPSLVIIALSTLAAGVACESPLTAQCITPRLASDRSCGKALETCLDPNSSENACKDSLLVCSDDVYVCKCPRSSANALQACFDANKSIVEGLGRSCHQYQDVCKEVFHYNLLQNLLECSC